MVIVGPARRCLACWGHIDPNRIRIETLSPEDRAREVTDGYITGADVPQLSVIAFNTAVASAAVIELLRLVTEFAGADDPPVRLSFDFQAGTVRQMRCHHLCAARSACLNRLQTRNWKSAVYRIEPLARNRSKCDVRLMIQTSHAASACLP